MFKAKRIDTGEIETVLAVDYSDTWHQTYFLVWSSDAWRWRPAFKYVPPNISILKPKQSGDIVDEDPPF